MVYKNLSAWLFFALTGIEFFTARMIPRYDNSQSNAFASRPIFSGECESEFETIATPSSCDKAAEIIEAMDESVVAVYLKGGEDALLAMPGIGKGIAQTIEELATIGRSAVHDELKKKMPIDLSGLRAVEGLGPQKIRRLYKELGITTLASLEEAARGGKIRALEGFGEKSEQKIIKGVEFLKRGIGRFLLGDILPWARSVEIALLGVRGVKRAQIAGSMRRRRETVGDADFLVIAADSASAMDFFTAMPDVEEVIARGDTKASVRLRNGLQADLRVVPAESYGAALSYFTGSRDHNVALRQIAQDKGLKLNEYGLFRGDVAIAGETEDGIYKALGLAYVPPELREMTGEVAAAAVGTLPNVIGYADLMGDLQVQTSWTDGAHSIEEMAHAAKAAGLSYMVVTDHTKRLAMMGGLNEKKLLLQIAEIASINKKFTAEKIKFRILTGSECDILKDGSLDLSDEALSKLDVVGVSIHSYFDLSRAEQTARVVRALRNPNADIFFHPTARKINRRPAIDLDMAAVIAVAKETGTVMEIDAFPDRLDLKDEYIRQCVASGVKLAIDSDAHDKVHFSVLEYGIAQARRGWARRTDIINAWPADEMLAMLKGR